MLDQYLPPSLLEFEKTYRKEPLIQWSNDHGEVPIFAAAIYVVMVFYLPNLIRKKFNHIKPFLAMWNLALAVFSVIGASRCVPAFVKLLSENGWVASVCSDTTYLDGASGVWMSAFVYSKFFELIDTVFLILNKREVIFLHWFHHLTVLLYCWHAYSLAASSGLWFATMNYCVHSIMYFYYFLMVFKGIQPLIRPIAPLITCIQLSQMVGGIAVNIQAAMTMQAGEPCAVHPSTWKLGLGMYVCYFILFAMLFYDKFIAPKTGKKICAPDSGCSATDANGMFRSDSSANLLNEGKKRR